jgi:hypothetical protein
MCPAPPEPWKKNSRDHRFGKKRSKKVALRAKNTRGFDALLGRDGWQHEPRARRLVRQGGA